MLAELCQFSSNDHSASTTLSSSSGSRPSSPSAKRPERPAPTSPVKESSQPKSYAGVCVVDAGTMDRIGGGRLQDYIINSNTWINKFATNVLDEKPDNLPPESMKGTPFDSLLNAPITKQVEDYGNKTGPLRLVGHFLRDVGQRAVAAVQAYPSSSKFYTRTKVESLHRVVEDGKFVCWRLVLVSLASAGSSSPTNRQPGAAGAEVVEREEIYAVHVALATGGHQTMPTFANAAYRQKTVLSDVVCTMEGVELLKTKIHRYLRTCNSHGTVPSGRVVVIGGSHSAFSAAWVCLNLVNEDASHKLPPSSSGAAVATASLASSTMSGPITLNAQNQIKFGPSGVCILHRSAVRVYYASRADADHDHYPESSIVVNRVTGNINPFGGIRGDAKELWRAIRSTKEGRVRLLQVKSIPLANGAATTGGASGGTGTSTGTAAGAAGAGSTAAALKQSIVDKMLDEAVAIVWAAGYATNLVPLFDHNGRPIHVRVSKGQTEVDEHANLLLSEAHHGGVPLEGFQPSLTLPSYASAAGAADFQGVPVGNLYGSGLGYGLRATLDNGEPDGASGRADGVAVYLKRGATLVLASVLGNKVYGGLNIHSWEERNQLLKKQQHHQLQQQNAALALNMAQILSAGDATGAKSPAATATATATPSRRASFGSPARTAATRQATPSNRAATSSVGVRTPVNASTGSGAGGGSHSSGAAGGSARRPASAGRVRASSINSSSAPPTADAAAVVSKTAPSTKTTAVAAVTQRSGGDALDRIAQPTECGSQNQHAEAAASLSEPSTPVSALHPAKQQPPVTVKVLGSAGRAVVAATGGARSQAKVASSSPVVPPHRPAPHQQLREGIESSLAAGASSRRAAKAMPGPLALPMGAANFGLAPPAPVASPTAKHPPHSLARSLLSSSLK